MGIIENQIKENGICEVEIVDIQRFHALPKNEIAGLGPDQRP